ncbi:MAG: outer membrane protein assembly factor BamE [Halioglobus sp.]|nr:outer membrane protein assembly factor BamE [Halioglobus sp.]
MQRSVLTLFMLLMLTLTSACVYQAPLSQGNLLKTEDLEQVEVGMTRSQVRFLLGTPMVSDPFHKDRWDYVFYVTIGRQKATFKRWVTIYFDGDTVSRIERDRELNPDI